METYIFPGGLQLGALIAHHSMRFARARLTVGKHRAVVAREHFLDKGSHDGAVDIALARLRPKGAIERKLLRQLRVNGVACDNLTRRHHIHNLRGAYASLT